MLTLLLAGSRVAPIDAADDEGDEAQQDAAQFVEEWEQTMPRRLFEEPYGELFAGEMLESQPRQLRQHNRRRKNVRRRLEPEAERPFIVVPPRPRERRLSRELGASNQSVARGSTLFSFALLTDTHYWPTSEVWSRAATCPSLPRRTRFPPTRHTRGRSRLRRGRTG